MPKGKRGKASASVTDTAVDFLTEEEWLKTAKSSNCIVLNIGQMIDELFLKTRDLEGLELKAKMRGRHYMVIHKKPKNG